MGGLAFWRVGITVTVALVTTLATGVPTAFAASSLSSAAHELAAVSPPSPQVLGVEGSDHALWVRRAGATGFTGLGGTLAAAPAIAAVPQSGGPDVPLYVVTGSDHALWVRSDSQAWAALSKGSTYCIDNPAVVVTGTPGNATLTVACQGSDHALWIAQGSANPASLPSLAGWRSLGGVLVAGPAVASVAGSLTFVVNGSDGHIWSRTTATPFAQLPWQCLGHPALDSWGSTATFACDGIDHALWYANRSGGKWSPTTSAGGILIDGPGVAATSTGVTLVAERSDSAIWSNFVPFGGSPTGWSSFGGAAQGGAGATGLDPELPWSVNRPDTYRVAQEDGPGSINKTDIQWDVYGADLGHMFVTGTGQIALTFGDSYGGPASDPFQGVPHSCWRSNTMALIDPPANPPSSGLPFSSMITDPSSPCIASSPPGAVPAKRLLAPTASDVTVIPTYGVALGTEMFLHYMSVKQWGAPGHWTLNNSGIASSTDGGQTWTEDPNARWPGDSNFGQVSMVRNQPDDGYVYVFGIPGGRYGGLQLARVPANPTSMLDVSHYQYWDGKNWLPGQAGAAVDIVPAPVGELSVQWNSYYQKWLMTYLVDPTGQIVLRTSNSLTGPWSAPQVIVDSTQYPELYGPFITPLWDNGPDIYFNMSMFGPYQVFLMHTSLTPATAANPPLVAANPSTTPAVPRPTYPFAHGVGSTRTG